MQPLTCSIFPLSSAVTSLLSSWNSVKLLTRPQLAEGRAEQAFLFLCCVSYIGSSLFSGSLSSPHSCFSSISLYPLSPFFPCVSSSSFSSFSLLPVSSTLHLVSQSLSILFHLWKFSFSLCVSLWGPYLFLTFLPLLSLHSSPLFPFLPSPPSFISFAPFFQAFSSLPLFSL